MMRAIVASGLGEPEVVELRSVALHWPRGPGDVLVRLKAAGINPADAYFRRFGPYVQSEAPFIPGHDGAGDVEAFGAQVRRFKPGDAVCFCDGGIGGDPVTYAEFAVVPASRLVPKPPHVDFIQAAALPLVAITLWSRSTIGRASERGSRCSFMPAPAERAISGSSSPVWPEQGLRPP